MYISADVTPAIKARQAIELRIMRSLVDELLAAGFELAVHDGEEWHARTTDKKAIFDALYNTDEDRLFVYKTDGPKGRRDWFGWVMLVYGNDGHDVISDNTTNLEQYITRTSKLAERLAA